MSRAAGSDESWRGTSRTPFWLDDPDRPPQRGSLDRHVRADLPSSAAATPGLWTALLAKERDPDRDVVLLEAASIGWAASGRNGGFCAASLTHGAANGLERFADEFDTLERLGRDNLAGLVADVERLGIDCDLEATGELYVATEDYQVADLREAAELGRRRVPRPRRGARRGRLTDVPRRALGPRRLRDGAPRPSWPGDWPARPRSAACASTKAPTSAASSASGTACGSPRRTAPSRRARSRSAPTRSRRCCVASGRTSSRSTTTR